MYLKGLHVSCLMHNKYHLLYMIKSNYILCHISNNIHQYLIMSLLNKHEAVIIFKDTFG